MSRIGKKHITIPDGVTIEINGQEIKAKGLKGELQLTAHYKIVVKKEDNIIRVTRKGDDKLARSLHGLTRKLIDNMAIGVSKGFERKLEIKGVGYKAVVNGDKLVLNVGYSHPVEIIAPKGVTFQVQKNIITASGIDKQAVGQIAAEIRAVRKPEPYKGKGIKYIEEIIRRKAGKAVKATAGGGA